MIKNFIASQMRPFHIDLMTWLEFCKFANQTFPRPACCNDTLYSLQSLYFIQMMAVIISDKT